MNNPIYDAAKDALARGWSVMPVSRTAGKVPAVKWKKYQSETPSEDELRAWFENSPALNLGVITGALSGLFIVDTDTPEAVQWMEAGGVPRGPMAQGSADYKRHYYFAWPGFVVKNSVKQIHPGADVRGEGGYAVLPPSVHKNGAVYEWIVSPKEAPLPVAPDWLLTIAELQKVEFVPEPMPLMNRPDLNGSAEVMQKYANAALNAELSLVLHAPEGQKHAQLFKSVAACAEFIPHGLLDESVVRSTFYDAVQGRAEDKRGARKTIDDALQCGIRQPRRLPDPPQTGKAVLLRSKSARAYIGGKSTEHAEAEQEGEPAPEGADEDEKTVNEGVYAIQNGRTVLAVSKEKQSEGGSQNQISKQFVADFAAFIETESRDEEGNSTLGVKVKHMTGAEYQLQIPGGTLLDARSTVKVLGNALGHHSMVYAGMDKHLGPSILSFTRGHSPKLTRLFRRTGWTERGEFLIPGMEPPDVHLTLAKELSYRVEINPEGLTTALDKLLGAHLPSLTPVALIHSLMAPLSKKAGWHDEKFALFITGRSGVFKTSWAQMLMSIYGDFGTDDKLLRFGAGGTVNALMDFPANAADLPLLIDNFKPGTGNGQKDAQTMVHGLLEGTEKKRMNRDGTLRPTKELRCWLCFTGEDTVSDAASVARMLILNASWPENTDNESLSWCQANGHILPRIGGAWIQWLLDDANMPLIERVSKTMGAKRGVWVAYLRKANPTMINAMRVATSLALCECGWEIASQCPAFGEVLDWWRPAFLDALKNCAGNMAGYSAQSHEANRYIAALRSLVIGQRAYFAHVDNDADKEDRRTFLGWEDEEFVYLLPDNAFNAALEALRNQNGLNNLGIGAISKQLDQLGFLAKKDGTNYAPKKKLGTMRARVLCIPHAKFYDDAND